MISFVMVKCLICVCLLRILKKCWATAQLRLIQRAHVGGSYVKLIIHTSLFSSIIISCKTATLHVLL